MKVACSHNTVMENWPHYSKVVGLRAAAAPALLEFQKMKKSMIEVKI
jgi:hypothetical protein